MVPLRDTAVTAYPFFTSLSQTADPTNPVPPNTATRFDGVDMERENAAAEEAMLDARRMLLIIRIVQNLRVLCVFVCNNG